MSLSVLIIESILLISIQPHGITKEVIQKKLAKIGKLYKKAVAAKDNP